MIKIFGNERCTMCRTAEMWIDRGLTTTEAVYISIKNDEKQKELEKKYNTEIFGYPFIVDEGNNNELMIFNDLMDLFKKNKKVK